MVFEGKLSTEPPGEWTEGESYSGTEALAVLRGPQNMLFRSASIQLAPHTPIAASLLRLTESGYTSVARMAPRLSGH
jgi:hypothetical protein